ncbi:MAG TPA: hypothetical protein VEK15_13785 [Vicinamibacteria bacterium]|nr:hypothetical protein [Vicinamibacteria bacterium]
MMRTALCLALAVSASASERIRYGGELIVNYSARDEGYFNFVQYDRSGLRIFRVNFAAELHANDHFAFLTEIRTDNLDVPLPYALYVRLKPWPERSVDIEVGRIPPVFGAFARRRYEQDNPLIGYPLAYQYPTVMRADAAPASVSELLSQRGRGAMVYYSIGERSLSSGLPIFNPLKWDTGASVRAANQRLEGALAVTQGTVTNPLVRDDNSGKQLAGRLGWRPGPAWIVGVSGARGAYVSDEVGAEGFQTAWGMDAEFSQGYWILRSELIWSRWDAPTLDVGPLDALAWMLEGRYKLGPGFYVAGRADHIGFSQIVATWDAPVSRFEIGVGYNFHRHVLGKFSIQHNRRDGGRVRSDTIPAAQVLFWF